MSELGEFRPITDLCQFEMTDEERSLCNQTVEDWTGKLKGYCFTIQQADPADQFCMTALPSPSPNVRTQNILGDRARTGRLMVIPQLPVDHDDLPEMLQDVFDEDAYTAIMEDKKLQSGGDDFRRWSIELFTGIDLGGISAPLHAEGGSTSPIHHGDPTSYAVRVGGGLDLDCRFGISEPADLFVSAGAEYYFNYSAEGGNLHSWLGRLRFGIVLGMNGSSAFEAAAIAKLGYTESDGPVYHPASGEVTLSYLDGGVGASLGWVWQGETLRAGFEIEGLYNFMRDDQGGVSITPFPIPFILNFRLGWNL